MRTRSTAFVVLLVFASLLPVRCPAAMSLEQFVKQLAFAPAPAPVRLNARADLEVSAAMAPEMKDFWNTHYQFSEQTTANYLQAVRQVLAGAIRDSGLFSRQVPGGATLPMVRVKVRFELFDPKVLRGRLMLQAVDPATDREICQPVGEMELGLTMSADGETFHYEKSQFQARTILGVVAEATRHALQTMLPRLEATLAERVQEHLGRPVREQAATTLQSAPLSELLVATDSNVELARTRNHALIAARIQQLPDLLRNTKTAELTDLLVKIEQTVLDLDHNCAVNNDRAQRLLAANGNPRQIESLRELAITYRERVELLKPMAAAIKEELANRNR